MGVVDRSGIRDGRVEDFVVDAEFIETETGVDLVSLALVGDGGREMYVISADHDPSLANEFVLNNVIPQLEPRAHPAWQSRADIRRSVLSFVGESVPRFWSWGGAPYDWLVLAQLFPLAERVPDGWRFTCYDITQLAEDQGYRLDPVDDRLPQPPTNVHHALADARWAHQLLADLRAGYR